VRAISREIRAEIYDAVRLIDLPLWILLLLILYAVQQPVFACLTTNDSLIKTATVPFVLLALYGKCLMIFVVEFAPHKQRIRYLMSRAPQIAEEELTLMTYDECTSLAEKLFDPLEIRIITSDKSLKQSLTLDGVRATDGLLGSVEDNIFKIIITAEDVHALMEVSKWISDRWRKEKPKVARINNYTVNHAEQVSMIIADHIKRRQRPVMTLALSGEDITNTGDGEAHKSGTVAGAILG
jgi:hypothetical protein